MGHTDHERRRLALQGLVLNPLTEQFLRRAGIGPGMRVLEPGCGVGEVLLILARLVGPQGHVTGIDIDGAALEIAGRRAAQDGLANVTLLHDDLAAHRPAQLYDAVAGRLILVHTRNPLDVVRHAASLVRPGGVVAFQDGYFAKAGGAASYPESPLLRRIYEVMGGVMGRVIPCADVGLRLFHLMLEAGLESPDCRFESVIAGGPDSPAYEMLAETVRSLLPAIEAFGLATAAEMDVDTLASRLRDEVVALRAGIFTTPLFSAFARKPATRP